MVTQPTGEEREVKRLESASIDGAPIAYIVALAAVVAVLAMIPLSIVISSGKSFPMSQAVYPLVGWILGPIAGALADGVGALVGVILFPHTTTMPAATVLGAAMGGLAAGAMTRNPRRKHWVLLLSALFVALYVLYAGWAVVRNGAALYAVAFGSFIDWSAVILFVLPTRIFFAPRAFFARRIGDSDLKRVAVGLFGGTWIIAGLTHMTTSVFIYLISNWPNELWLTFAPMAPFEHLVRCGVGAIIGSGVIAGLRAIQLVKPTEAMY